MLWLLAIACHAEDVSWDVGAPETCRDFAFLAPVTADDGSTGTLYVSIAHISLDRSPTKELDMLLFGRRDRADVVQYYPDVALRCGSSPRQRHARGNGRADLVVTNLDGDSGFLDPDTADACPTFRLTFEELRFPRAPEEDLVVDPFTIEGPATEPGFDCDRQ